MTVGFQFPDVDEAYGIEIRRGVAQFVEHLPARTDLTITLGKTALDRIRSGQLSLGDAVRDGTVQVSGGPPAEIARFLGYFEVPFGAPIRLALPSGKLR
jgi:alkyl sulfatase BDS1-like metallo-beta-lactamase superfamily hydrolase